MLSLRRRCVEGRQEEEVLARLGRAAEMAYTARPPHGRVVEQVADDAGDGEDGARLISSSEGGGGPRREHPDRAGAHGDGRRRVAGHRVEVVRTCSARTHL